MLLLIGAVFFQSIQENPATGGITIDNVAVAIPEFWANVAIGALTANTVMAQLVNRDFDEAIATVGDTVNIIRRGALVVNDKLTGKQITLQTPSNTKIPVVLDKHKEVSWLIEDTASAKAIKQALDYITDAAIAIGEQIDRDLLGLYADIGSSVGTPGQALSVDTILAARERLNVQKCPQANRVFVISPQDETALLKTEQFTNATWDSTNTVALQNATLGRKYGFVFLMDQQVINTGASPATRHNMAFIKDAFVLVTRPLPAPPAGSGATSAVLAKDGFAIRVTSSYSQKDGGLLFTMDVLYGIKTVRGEEFAVEVEC